MHGHPRMLSDEVNHYPQIALFLRGDIRVLVDYLTTIPGYHALVAALMRVFGADGLDAARLVNAAFGLVAAGGFHALRRDAWPGTESIATAQLLVLPILVPLFFIVYTDVLALALVLWAVWATLRGCHWVSVALLCVLVCVRQNAVVWSGFAAVLALWPIWRRGGSGAWRELARVAWPYLLPSAGFLGFWAWNGSISLSTGQAAMHPDLQLHAGNVFLALFLAGALLPLHVVTGLGDFAGAARRRGWLMLLPIALFAAVWFGFRVDNPYNTALPDYYVRNAFLLAVASDPLVRAAFGLVVAAAACALAPTPLRPSHAAWLYAFGAFFLAASWLIEQRYALVPLVLWLAFRRQRSTTIEFATFALWLLLAVCVYAGMISDRFFL
ncbi:MAG: hypothetical protein EOP90_07870 [Lysobacteraceae bacterium]|nr:MAG: hypothetical protein EOP90_07870 [Xanthomonadaceae bacterium]